MTDTLSPAAIRLTIPIRLVSELNRHEHYMAKAKRVKGHREAGFWAIRARMRIHADVPPPPCTITITRIAPRTLDSDNLAGCAKALRDGIADAIGVDDGSSLIDWRYAQRRGGVKEYAVEIAIAPRKDR